MSNHTPIHHLIDEHKKKKEESSVTISKEGEPVKLSTEAKSETNVEQVEPEIEQEDNIKVEKYVQPTGDDFSLDPELKKAGLQIVDSSSDPRYNIKLPIPDDKIEEGLHKPVNSSWRWLSEIGRFILRCAHISLKKIHGHVVRVIKK